MNLNKIQLIMKKQIFIMMFLKQKNYYKDIIEFIKSTYEKQKLNISTANKNYPIVIGSNIFTNFYKNISSYKNNKVFIITDKNINGLYQKDLKKIKNKNLDLNYCNWYW